MKKSSKVKYFGVAAAALLAVAPVVAPAFTAANNEPATVQAATGTPATITGKATIADGETAYAFVNSNYNSGILTEVKAVAPTTTEFNDGDKIDTINGITYYVTTGSYTYNNNGNPVRARGTYYVEAPTVLTYNYAVNQYFQNAGAERADVTIDGENPAAEKPATAVSKQLKNGTANVLALYTKVVPGTTESTVAKEVAPTPATVTKDVPADAEAGTPAVTAGTEVTGNETDGYKATVNGTEVTIEASNVTPATAGVTAGTAVTGEAGAYKTTDKDGNEVAIDDADVETKTVETPATEATTEAYYAIAYRGTTYFVKADGVSLTTAVNVNDVTGTITTNRDDVRTYSDAATQNYTGNLIRTKGTQLGVDQVATTGVGDNTAVAYHVVNDADTAAGTWVRAQDVTFNDSVLVASAAKGTVTANADNTTLYTDKATTNKSGETLVEGQDVNYTRVVKNSVTGDIVAYGYLNTNQGTSAYNSYVYVKAADVTVNNAADVDTAKLPAGTAVYSNNKAATIYTDAAATKDSGAKLSTDVNEWSAFETSTDADGNIVAYRLGKNQWVKAADLELQQDLDGTFDVAAGTTLYSVDGDKTGTIENGGSYKVFAVRYINGKQSLKLGTDNQWVVASQGDFYPA